MFDLALFGRSEAHTGNRWLAFKDRVTKIGDHDTWNTGVFGGLVDAFELSKIFGFKSNLDTVIGFVERDSLGAHLFRFEISIEVSVACLGRDFPWRHIEIATNYGVETIWIGVAVHAGIRSNLDAGCWIADVATIDD